MRAIINGKTYEGTPEELAAFERALSPTVAATPPAPTPAPVVAPVATPTHASPKPAKKKRAKVVLSGAKLEAARINAAKARAVHSAKAAARRTKSTTKRGTPVVMQIPAPAPAAASLPMPGASNIIIDPAELDMKTIPSDKQAYLIERIKYMIANHDTLRYYSDGKALGIDAGWDWRAFSDEFMARKARFAAYFGVPDNFVLDLEQGKYHAWSYLTPLQMEVRRKQRMTREDMIAPKVRA